MQLLCGVFARCCFYALLALYALFAIGSGLLQKRKWRPQGRHFLYGFTCSIT
jgi:hypothetical protein